MINLEQYYKGDEDWVRFSGLYATMPQSKIVTELKKLFPDESLACVIAGIMGDSALDWIHRKIPALDNLTPLQCISTPVLVKRLKEGLMRMDV